MANIQVFKKEVPPISVRELERELETLSTMVDQLTNSGLNNSDQLFKEITARLNPNLVKALVMIARKQTTAILKSREKVWLTHLGRVRLHGVTKKNFLQWVDALVAEDGTPFLRRVAVSEDGIEFFSITWAGCTSIACVDTERWDYKKKVWVWDSANCVGPTSLRRDGVLPYLPMHLSKHERIEVFDWDRHLEFSSIKTLFQAVDAVGEGAMHEIERDAVLKLLQDAQADMNPLWSHLARDAEYD